MAISRTIQTPISKGNASSVSDSVSLIEGDLLIYCIHNRDNLSYTTPTWNGQTLTQAASVSAFSFLRVFYVRAAATATANVTATVSGFSATNVSWAILRSSINAIPANPFRDIKTSSHVTGTYADPTVTLLGLESGDNVVAFLGWSGWDKSFNVVQSTTATENNLTASGVIQNSSNQNTPGRTYVSSGTGYSGNTAVGYTRVGAGAPVHNFIALAVMESAQSLIISTPLTPNVSRTDTCTGFPDGAATLSFSGVSISVTIVSGSFTYTVPMLADGVVWPRLPATGQTITLTQGALVSNTTANIDLPVGYNRLRDGSNNVANFAGLIADDDTYLQFHFVAAGNALTTNDTAYHVTSDNYVLLQNSGINVDTDSLPRTDTLYIHRASGTIGAHSVTINAAGDIVSVGGLTVAGITVTSPSVSGLTVTGL